MTELEKVLAELLRRDGHEGLAVQPNLAAKRLAPHIERALDETYAILTDYDDAQSVKRLFTESLREALNDA